MTTIFSSFYFFLLLSSTLFFISYFTPVVGVPDPTLLNKFEGWMTQYGRHYKNDTEKLYRLKVFEETLNYIDLFSKKGNKSYTLGLNQFSDLTHDEFVKTYASGDKNKTYDQASLKSGTPFRYGNVTKVPQTLNWTDLGAVTPVKYQGLCGSCWAFSAVASVEGLWKIKKGKLLSLSEQIVIDCDENSTGCDGGYTMNAFEFIKKNGGIPSESDYPYMEIDGTCNLTIPKVASITGYERVPVYNETALLAAVANQPVSISVDGSEEDFQSYSGGIYDGACNSTDLNHAMTVVGYDQLTNGDRYWIVKNSYGTSWGDNGYIYYSMGISGAGACGLATRPSYPVY